ncbi:phage tail sheath protein FI [Pelomonas saccharophila]|uniref:Phage tail sheath protein FI n=1 Tax=Roseateles saccharophilus TaxID=304 RepID=A0ABU1YVD4_ROSSA|nr:phage tail sheath subtilisin-like domain-containing protein [Roseateles saccharophilus]MDR7271931.1 phage tail sheath protein FI [Roseateles saccharophilus]
MPEYLAPGVYVEETSFRAKSIEGVGTSTTAFAGPTRKGPIATAELLPEILTSFADFERIYGGTSNLDLQADTLNYMAHAVRAYFNEGGSRLYVARVFLARGNDDSGLARTADLRPAAAPAEDDTNRIRFVARFPGASGNGAVPTREQPQLRGIQTREILAPAPQRVLDSAPLGSMARGSAAAPFSYFVKRADGWHAVDAAGADGAAGVPDAATAVLITLAVITTDADGSSLAIDDLGYDRAHPRWLGTVMPLQPNRRVDQIENLYAANLGSAVNGLQLLNALFPGAAVATGRRGSFPLTEGNDGAVPTDASYAGAFAALAKLDDIAIVAAPGSSAYASRDAIRNALISHAEGRRMYRIAVLDTNSGLNAGAAREARATIDSKYAAMYYPWVVIANPNARPGRDDIPREIALPPSGFICGIYARNDIERGVFKAPANEIVRGALRFERDVSFGEQEVLNPLGINCLRYFPGRGYRVWGARTASSDPEWKYVNVRRYFNYLEASIDRSTQWAVFEPNGERLWANIRETIAQFLYNEWRNGALLGGKAEEAYFVRCDRSTMTQNDLDNGRLVCQIGVAALKPAEFVIFRIGQKTADSRD